MTMDPKYTSSSRAVYWATSLITVAIIAGISVWWYSAHRRTIDSTITTATPVATTTSDPVLAASTDIDATLTDVDSELATINTDLSSTNDDTPTL